MSVEQEEHPHMKTVLCHLGCHSYRWVFVGNEDAPDAQVLACRHCGSELSR